jgi:cytochrome c-type biogenesis protein CcmH/NrfG
VKEKISIFAVGLVVGLVAGFVVTNYLNRPEFAPGAASTTAATRGGQPQPQPGPNANEQQISDEELQHIKETVDANPEKYEDQLMLADYLMRIRHMPVDSIKYYERANALKPTELKPLVGLGDANLDAASETTDEAKRNEMLVKATGYYEKALAIEPKNVNLLTDMGLTYFFRSPSETEKAIAQYRKSLAIDPKHEITLLNLTIALLSKGDAPAAEETIATLQSVNPAHERIPQLRANLDKVKTGEKIPSH